MESSEISTRHLLDIAGLSNQDIRWLLDRALEHASGTNNARCPNLCVANLFYEASTRTRVSFELAARRLGADVVNIELARSSTQKGETLVDTAATLAAMGVNALVLRHPDTGAVAELAGQLLRPMHLLNAGDGQGEHPSQALLDAATLERSGLNWPEAKLSIVGDLRHSRVARSNIALLRRLGLGHLCLAGPSELLPDWVDDEQVEVCGSLEQALHDADAVMMLRVQHERIDRTAWPDPADYARHWCLRPEHLALAGPDCRILHPGPINRGMEIDSAVADGPRSLILDQVGMGVATRMAIFEWLLKMEAS
ncbi:aspartate carbamoyltransferase catalytic subunit [Wenzhouxiangella marina]|uniref:Aspartate carbamoyltransferase n=1 Tax=Wenzhouxiangella marina TaxID=1579979 RepID=A0A0K0XSS0_9GAMM|nr:aspartate carbamoyltransferase catalytic subunit [Wenzhouxiangella marina]AKS40754.1 Aspartate carbamoyltransferase catalytic subunit [Wenzhouxiangella marina]MBB6087627.1 aspartate carbamoyltransferase catalytic subunit [Wenzhouxiangella marina]